MVGFVQTNINLVHVREIGNISLLLPPTFNGLVLAKATNGNIRLGPALHHRVVLVSGFKGETYRITPPTKGISSAGQNPIDNVAAALALSTDEQQRGQDKAQLSTLNADIYIGLQGVDELSELHVWKGLGGATFVRTGNPLYR